MKSYKCYILTKVACLSSSSDKKTGISIYRNNQLLVYILFIQDTVAKIYECVFDRYCK